MTLMNHNNTSVAYRRPTNYLHISEALYLLITFVFKRHCTNILEYLLIFIITSYLNNYYKYILYLRKTHIEIYFLVCCDVKLSLTRLYYLTANNKIIAKYSRKHYCGHYSYTYKVFNQNC